MSESTEGRGGSGGGSPGGGGTVNTGSGLDDIEDKEVNADTVVDNDHVSASVKIASPLKSAVMPTSAVGVSRSTLISISVCIPKS